MDFNRAADDNQPPVTVPNIVRTAALTLTRSASASSPIQSAIRESNVATLLVRTTQACGRPPRLRSETGTSNGHGPWLALVIINTQMIENASVAAGAAMTSAGR